MPWRGPEVEGEFPTLGYQVGEWIQQHVVVPDGYRRGQPYLLTDEMWRFLLRFYRLYDHAEAWPAPDALFFTGAQLRRSQKWGKDPLGAAIILAEAFGPTRFDGWDAAGEPVGAPYPSPLIVCLGVSEDATANTWKPLLNMIRLGPLVNLPGIDAGQTRVLLPCGNTIDPVTTSAKSRLGAPITFLTVTESGLFTLQGGFRKVAGTVKRNVAGMDGRWLELTNGWDPSEGSEAQVTAEADDPRVLIDNVEPNRVADLTDRDAVYAELLRQYGDSARERGGWVNVGGRILHETMSGRHLESDRRRFFLNELVVGENVLVDPLRWDLAAYDDVLAPWEPIALGFDGSKYRAATALVASRISDGRLFAIRCWERPDDADSDWRVPSAEVDQVVRQCFAAYDVKFMYCDPFRWQDIINSWAAQFEKKVVEFPTNQQMRMDKAIERFTTGFNSGEVSHDGSAALTRHMKNCVIVKGDRRKLRPGDEEESLSRYYMCLAPKADGRLIDMAVAAVLAHHGRGKAIEEGALVPVPSPQTVASAPEKRGGSSILRPTERLKI